MRITLESHRSSTRLRDQTGAAIVTLMVMLVALFGLMAVAIDITRLLSTRAELQTAVDAAALAGAVELARGGGDDARTLATNYAALNFAENDPVALAPEDIVLGTWDAPTRTFNPLPGAAGADAIHVRTRKQVSNWVAWLLNIVDASPGAEAIAWAAAPVAETSCVKPWAIPEELMDYDNNGEIDDWEADQAVQEEREFNLKAASGGAGDTLASSGIPSFFYPVVLPPLWDDSRHEYNNLSGLTGAANYRSNIADCHPNPVGVGDSLLVEPGNMPGPTIQGARDLCDRIVDTWCYGADGSLGVPLIAAFWDSEEDPIGRTTVRVARLGSFRLVRAYPEGSHGVIVGRFEGMIATGGVGTVSTTIQRPILVR